MIFLKRKLVIKADVSSRIFSGHRKFLNARERLEPSTNAEVTWSYSFPVWAMRDEACREAWQWEMMAQFERHLDEVAEALK